jgi:hypothetical protein
MVEEGLVTGFHGAQEVARLVVAHAVPERAAARLQVVDGKHRRFGFQ